MNFENNILQTLIVLNCKDKQAMVKGLLLIHILKICVLMKVMLCVIYGIIYIYILIISYLSI